MRTAIANHEDSVQCSQERNRVGKRMRLHIDGGKTTVGDGTADGTSKGESGVEVETAQLCWVGDGSDILLDGIQLGRASGGGGSSASTGHFE